MLLKSSVTVLISDNTEYNVNITRENKDILYKIWFVWCCHMPGFKSTKFSIIHRKIVFKGIGEIIQWVRALAVLAEDPSSGPRTHIGHYKSSFKGYHISGPRVPAFKCTDT